MQKLSSKQYEVCRDHFYDELKGHTYADTDTNAVIECAWQLKRIADYLETIACDGILQWSAGPP